MSQANPPTAQVAAPAAPAAPVPAPHRLRERRVRFGHLALAISLVVVGALGTATLVMSVSATGEYLALARDVEYGTEITEADLVTVNLSNPPGLSPVPTRDLDRVVGNYATMPLAAGSLLTSAHVTDERFPAAGEVRLGITVHSNRLPAQSVQPGHLVMLVDTSADEPTGEEPASSPRTWQATVVRVAGDDSGGGILSGGGSREVTIDVVVGTNDAPVIATLAAADGLSVAVMPGQAGS